MASKAIEQLLGYGKADRTVRAYAYLTATFNVRNDASDLLDCLLPFVIAVVARDGCAHPVELSAVVEGLAELGLSVPVYAVGQLLGRLQRKGLLEWNAVSRTYLPTPSLSSQRDIEPPTLSSSFDTLDGQIAAFAETHGFSKPPASSSWSDALINFLRSEGAKDAIKAAKAAVIRDVIVGNPAEIETFLMARFVQITESRDPETFADITKVFTGVIIEDFISNIQEVGSPNSFKGLAVFYDTAVLLRLLGTSGYLLQTATLEMHTTLQGLGCNTYYFDPTAAEVQSILDSLAGAYSRGQEIFGETADAIHHGETSIGQIRDLAGTFQTRLGALNVFPFEYHYGSRKSEDYFQISESDLAEALKSGALINDRGYSGPNAANDASVVALVVRLRRGRSARSIGTSHYIMISKNSLLQRVSREFVKKHTEHYDGSSIPPVLTMGQITTAAWIAATKKLEAHKVSKELLASCYAAVQPSEAWADEFARVMEKFKEENPELVADRANAMLFLNTARNVARDESLNQPLVLKKINVAELFRQAAEAEQEASKRAEEERTEQLARLERDKAEALERAEQLAAQRISEEGVSAENRGRAAERQLIRLNTARRLRENADRTASWILVGAKALLFVLFAASLAIDLFNVWPELTWKRLAATVMLGLLTSIAFLDSLEVRGISSILEWLRQKTSDLIYRLFVAVVGDGTPEDIT